MRNQYNLTDVPAQIEITQSGIIQIIHDSDWGTNLKSNLSFLVAQRDITARIELKIIARAHASIQCDILGLIEKSASQTDLYISVQTLMLDESAFVSITPSLEIKHNEVKAGHGATIGYLDPVDFWYLQSHGISELETETMLVKAFLDQ
jgi:Fe-S cluster assembly scaffold protein SufB